MFSNMNTLAKSLSFAFLSSIFVIGCGGSGSSPVSTTGSGSTSLNIPPIHVGPGDLYVGIKNSNVSSTLSTLGGVYQFDPTSTTSPTQVVQLNSDVVFAAGLVLTNATIGDSSFIYAYSTLNSGAIESNSAVYGQASNGTFSPTGLTNLPNVGNGVVEITPTPNGFFTLQDQSTELLTLFSPAGAVEWSKTIDGGYDYCAQTNQIVYVTQQPSDGSLQINIATLSSSGPTQPLVLATLPSSTEVNSIAISKDGAEIAYGEVSGTTGSLMLQATTSNSVASAIVSGPSDKFTYLAFGPTTAQLAYSLVGISPSTATTNTFHIVNPSSPSNDSVISFFSGDVVNSLEWANATGTSY